LKNLLASPKINIKQAMKKLGESGEKCLVIVDENNYLLGTLSNGDLRNAIINGATISDSIQYFYQKNPTTLTNEEYSHDEAKEIFLREKFDLIPVIDKKNKLVKVLFLSNIFSNKTKNQDVKLDIPVVVMAGGKGTRMEPFTNILPKPLIPVHEKPIIEHIIESFTEVGCKTFYLTVNYKGRILKAYFEELLPDYIVNFVDEKEPLGTAGSLRFLYKKLNQPFFVTNCDIIIKSNYASLYEFHQKGGFDITLVASAKEYIIPYGTCELNKEGHLAHINEKPQYDFLFNTGLYLLNPDMIGLIPKNKFYHITHLIEDAKNLGKKIGVFPINDDAWIDIGQWAEYKKAVNKL